MKKILILLALLIPSVLFAQKIEKNEYDRFNKYWIVETKMEKITDSGKIGGSSMSGYKEKIELCMRRTGEKWQMLAILKTEGTEKYDEGSGLSILLDNDDVIVLESIYTGVGYVFSTVFHLTKEDIEKLTNHNIIALRNRYMGGHDDYDISKDKQDLITKMINIIENEFYQKTLLQNE